MNASIKILFKPDNYTRQDGTKQLRLRLIINRRVKYYPLHVYVNPKHFKNGRISVSDPGHFNKNRLLEYYYNKANKIIFDHRINEESITFDTFERSFSNDLYGSKSFYDYADQLREKLKGKLTPGTLKNYKDQINKLKSFRLTLQFKEIDRLFIEKYEIYLIKERKNNPNTVTKSLIFIKSILNKALADKFIKTNVFDDIHLKRTEGTREFLTLDELKKLEKIYTGNELKPNKVNVLRYFLFCCYTGLRYSDVKKLRFNDIKENKYISIEMIKTKEPVIIPLIEKSRELLPEPGFKMQPVFKVLTDQPTNRYLKEIMELASNNKQISFHCARHTFATVARSCGMEYDAI